MRYNRKKLYTIVQKKPRLLDIDVAISTFLSFDQDYLRNVTFMDQSSNLPWLP